MGAIALVLAVGWCAGVASGVTLEMPWPVPLTGALASGCAAMLASSPRTRLLALALMALLLGLVRVELALPADQGAALAEYPGDVVVRGRLLDAPTPRGRRAEAAVMVEAVSATGSARQFVLLPEPRPTVLLRATAIPARHGDQIEFRGQFARPRSRPGWPLAALLARRGIFWTVDTGYVRVTEGGAPGLLRWLVAARAYAEETARLTLPEPHASLVAGMVFGAASGLPSELRAALTTTGTSHLTAVSGANVALVAGGLLVVAVRVVGRRSASLVAIAGVWLYTLLVGAPPSALRAASMATLALAARGLGRQSDTIGGLALAAAILLGWNPGLAGDVGFQLSVAATAGLVLLTRPIEVWLRLVPHPIRGWLAVAIAAQLATLPIVLGTFQRLSLISLPANVLAAPLVPPIMLVGAALAVLGRLPILDSVLGWAGWGLTALLLFVIEQCAAVPGAVMAVGQLPSGLAVAWYGVLGCWVAASSADVRALGIPPRLLHGVALASVSLVPLVLLVGWGQAERPGSVVVSLLDTAPTAALIRAPDGRTVLVLTSQPGPGLVAGAGSSLDLWEGTIDTVISPDGIRSDVDLLSLGEADLLVQAADRESLQPGAVADLGNGLNIAIVDLRLVDDRPVLDLLILAEGAAILLPGPGSPSQHWADIPADLPSITMLPASAVSWARTLPPRPWLLLVGEPGLARAGGDSGVPFLTRREYGIVEIALRDGGTSVRTERCASGTRCQIELPPPIVTRLLPAADD